MIQREIEFRAKKNIDNSWVYGLLTNDMKGHYRINFDVKYFSCVVKPDTIGQFTGKYDKNKRKVYEGDIVLQQGYNGRKEKMVVRFENGAFIVGYHSGSSTRKKPMLISDKCEVIGNIHDTPELLQED